jgi:2-(1,2-epoxy-1,2-dihydrophenyl)acetyl-CoA isomerase
VIAHGQNTTENRLKIAPEELQARMCGRGDRLFRGSLKDFMKLDEPPGQYIRRVIRHLYAPLALKIYQMPKLVVTAVNGPAIGAGVGLALLGDLVFATQSAYFSLPFVPALGVVPDMGTTWLVPRLLGYSRALGYALTGEKLAAAEAMAAGLIWRCIPDADFHEAVQAQTKALAALPVAAVQRTKRAFQQAHINSFDEQLKLEAELQSASFDGPEFQEGLAAFRERRAPDFTRW